MGRKIKLVTEEKAKAARKLEEMDALLKEAQAEETRQIEEAEAAVKAIEKDRNMFCGVVLGKADLVAILDMALKTGESIKIPFKMYFIE